LVLAGSGDFPAFIKLNALRLRQRALVNR